MLVAVVWLNGLRAELAAAGSDGDVAEALRAGLGGRWRGCFRAFEFLQEVLRGQNENKVDDPGEQDERDCGVEEVSVFNFAAVDGPYEGGEVRLAYDGGDEWGNDVADERGDDCGEGSADDDGDGEVHNVAAQNEITKTFEHVLPPNLNGC